MEWALGRTEITLEISLDNHAGSWHSLNLDSDEECERHLALDDTEDWAWLAQQIRTKDGDVA
jgi:hypothetical protein